MHFALPFNLLRTVSAGETREEVKGRRRCSFSLFVRGERLAEKVAALKLRDGKGAHPELRPFLFVRSF